MSQGWYDWFDFNNPDYDRVMRMRLVALMKLRQDKDLLHTFAAHYRTHPWDFVNDWGFTFDPRNVGDEGKRSVMPFILFPKQVDWMRWAYDRWLAKQEGAAEKSRDMGLSWLSIALGCTLCVFYPQMVVGYGSRKEEYVDKAGAPKSLFFKGRLFMENLPVEFQGGWSRKTDAHMRIAFPGSGSIITGESGDSIGRGDRTGLYLTDEDAHIEHPDLVDAALSATTNCRLRVSSANGTANSFYLKRQQYVGTPQLFTFHWRESPLWSQERYDAKAAEVNNPVIMAQEYDINYSASVEGVLIPSTWVAAAVDAHKVLGFGFDGDRFGSLDVADGGKDKNALCGAHGVVIEHLEQWSGAGSDLYETTEKAFLVCDLKRYRRLRYDADGLGAGIKGDARTINERRKGVHSIKAEPWRASGEVINPERNIPGTDRLNKDFFANAKAQGYWELRDRFRKVYLAVRMVKDGADWRKTYPTDELISFDSSGIAPGVLAQAMTELSQPTAAPNGAGKMVVDKTPDESPSPNYADAIMMRFAPIKGGMRVSQEVLDMIRSGSARA